ncbi:MAG: Fic family protein [Firmicutes bacterium]|nr:Fic family protein [Bacillota bacterium]
MRVFNYLTYSNMLWDKEILGLVAEIHEHKGRHEYFLSKQPQKLDKLIEIAKIQSTEASNKIEGIVTTASRLGELMQKRTTPRNRDEEEIIGYRDVLDTIHESHEYISVSSNTILQLHRDLYKHTAASIGGKYKNADNIIQEIDAQGNKLIRFQPLAAYLTPTAMGDICNEYNHARSKSVINELLLLPIFILDFLCIHPFNDGNGRISRLLTLLLLYKNNYNVGKYVSIEKAIEQTKDRYYDALQASSEGWHDGTNDYKPFIRYMLGVILSVYRDFEERILSVEQAALTKSEQIRQAIDNKLGKITKAELKGLCPNISEPMIEITLRELLKAGYIEKVGAGSKTAYIKKTFQIQSHLH